MNSNVLLLLGLLFFVNLLFAGGLVNSRRRRFSYYIEKLYREEHLAREDHDFYIEEYGASTDLFSVPKASSLPKFEELDSENPIVFKYQFFRKRSIVALRINVLITILILGITTWLWG